MNLNAGAIERRCLDANSNNLVTLQLTDQAVQHSRLGPSIQSRIDRVPIAKPFAQRSPLAALLRNLEDRMENLKVGHRNIASL